jgi:biotin transport system substrate-specific component
MNNIIKSLDIASTNIVAKVVIGVLLLFAGSQINIPLKPVPMNLATISVMIIGLYYSPKEASISLISYLLMGIMGLPVFNNFNGGVIYFVGTTGGYLVGYAVAAIVMSYLRYNFSVRSIVIPCVIGQSIIFAFGVSWLSTFTGINNAVNAGFIIYIIPGFVKIMLLCAAINFIEKGKVK